MPRMIPTFIEPCSPKAAKTPPEGEDWVFEAKWDGYRCLVVKDGKNVRLYSRNRTEWTDRLPGLASSFASFGARSAVIDGELCVCDAEGRPDFRALHRASANADRISPAWSTMPSTCSMPMAPTSP